MTSCRISPDDMGVRICYQAERQCPACGSYDVARSRRHGVFESIVQVIFRLRPYRCRQCMVRYFGALDAVRIADTDQDRAA